MTLSAVGSTIRFLAWDWLLYPMLWLHRWNIDAHEVAYYAYKPIILECKNQNISNKLKLKCQEEKVTFNIRNVLAITTIAREAVGLI